MPLLFVRIGSVLLSLLLPATALAQNNLNPGWQSNICNLFPNGCATPGPGVTGLQVYISQNVYVTMQIMFAALLVGMLFFYATTMIVKSGDESAITESKAAYTYAIAGAAFAGLAATIAVTFSPTQGAGDIVYDPFVQSTFDTIYIFFKVLLGVALTANIVIQSFRLITSQGNDELIGRARKRLIASFIGVAIVLLANAIIVALRPDVGGPGIIISEAAGIVNFLLTLLGAISILAIIAAGFLLLVSIDEGLKDKSKQIIKTSIVAMVVILTAFVIVNFFIAVA